MTTNKIEKIAPMMGIVFLGLSGVAHAIGPEKFPIIYSGPGQYTLNDGTCCLSGPFSYVQVENNANLDIGENVGIPIFVDATSSVNSSAPGTGALLTGPIQNAGTFYSTAALLPSLVNTGQYSTYNTSVVSAQNDGTYSSVITVVAAPVSTFTTASFVNNGTIQNSGEWVVGNSHGGGSFLYIPANSSSDTANYNSNLATTMTLQAGLFDNPNSFVANAGTNVLLTSGPVTLKSGATIQGVGSFKNEASGSLALINSNFYGVGAFNNQGTVVIDASSAKPGNGAALTLYTTFATPFGGALNTANLPNLTNCAASYCTLSGGAWDLIGDPIASSSPSTGNYAGLATLSLGIVGLPPSVSPKPPGSYSEILISAIGTGTSVSLSGNTQFSQLAFFTSNAGFFGVDHGSWGFGQNFSNTGNVNNGPDSNAYQGMTVYSQFTNTGSISNSGNFTIASGAQINGTGSYVQYGGKTVVNSGASINQNSFDLNGGTLSGGGTVTVNNGHGTLNVYSGGTIGPGDPQTLTINGNLNVAGGALDLQIAGTGAGQYDVLNVTGRASFTGGTIVLDFIDGYAPVAGDSVLQLFAAAGGITGLSNASVEVEGLASGFQYQLQGAGTDSLSLLAMNDAFPAPVPLPQSVWLLLSGLFGVGFLRARPSPHQNPESADPGEQQPHRRR